MPDDGTALGGMTMIAVGKAGDTGRFSGAGRQAERLVARVRTVAFQGIDVLPVDVQVQMGPGMPTFTLADTQDPDSKGIHHKILTNPA